jgi:IS30 family transposase
MRTYTQMGHNRTKIAAVIGAHKSTVSRELRRNRGDDLRGNRFRRGCAGHQLGGAHRV